MYTSFSWAPEFRHPYCYTSMKIFLDTSLLLPTRLKKISFKYKFSSFLVEICRHTKIRGKISIGWRRSTLNDSLYLALHDFLCFFVLPRFSFKHSRLTGQKEQGKGEDIYLIPLYHFHPLHRHLGISRVITAGRLTYANS